VYSLKYDTMRSDQIILTSVVSSFFIILICMVCYGLRQAHLHNTELKRIQKENEKYMIDIRTIPRGEIIQTPVMVVNPIQFPNHSDEIV
jgi:hypothetical protein